MKIRSKALYNYLLEARVLNGTANEIACAKLAYRKQYKKRHKQRQEKRKEIRIGFYLPEFQAIKIKAATCNCPLTSYARAVILRTVRNDDPLIHQSQVLQILQLVSMALIGIQRDSCFSQISKYLQQAETQLLTISASLQ